MDQILSSERLEPRDRRSADWFWVHKSVWANSLLTPADKIVYGTMALFANGNSQQLYPSVETLQKFSGLSERQVRYSIKNLETVGYIHIDKHPGKASSYTLLDVSGAKFAPLQKVSPSGAKSGVGVVQNVGYEQELNNKNYLTKDNEKDKKPVSTEAIDKTRRELVKKGVLPR